MAKWLGVVTALPEYLSSSPSTHMAAQSETLVPGEYDAFIWRALYTYGAQICIKAKHPYVQNNKIIKQERLSTNFSANSFRPKANRQTDRWKKIVD